MGEVLVLDDGIARVELHPNLGGSVGRYDYRSKGKLTPIFDVSPDAGRSGAFALGCQILIPFANRISGGGFRHDGQFHTLEPNTPGDPYPNHGNGFQSAWSVAANTKTTASLTLRSNGPGPFRYDAKVTYTLDDGALIIELAVTNGANVSLPYGVGLHPWFTRTPQSTLKFDAEGCWSERPDHLPDRFLPRSHNPAFDFRYSNALPQQWVNMAFTGWRGTARLEWPEHALGVTLSANEPLSTLMIYSASRHSSFVCIEPVSHTVDAYNRTGPNVFSPQVLPPQHALKVAATIRPMPVALLNEPLGK